MSVEPIIIKQVSTIKVKVYEIHFEWTVNDIEKVSWNKDRCFIRSKDLVFEEIGLKLCILFNGKRGFKYSIAEGTLKNNMALTLMGDWLKIGPEWPEHGQFDMKSCLTNQMVIKCTVFDDKCDENDILEIESEFEEVESVDIENQDDIDEEFVQTSEAQKAAANKLQGTDLNVEANRLRTFENWRCEYVVDKHQLALFGFYYYGPGDMVKCYFCGVEIGMWQEGDDVLTNHMRWSPSCNLIRRNETNNVPINADLLNQNLPPAPTPDVYGAMERHTASEGSVDQLSQVDVHMYQHQLYGNGGIEAVLRGALNLTTPASRPKMSRPEHPEYGVEAKRLETFEDWPKSMRQRPQQLSDAGFYYTGKGDKVCCFSCGGGLKDWEENYDPLEQHAMWFGKCEYLKLMKDADFIAKMAQQRIMA